MVFLFASFPAFECILWAERLWLVVVLLAACWWNNFIYAIDNDAWKTFWMKYSSNGDAFKINEEIICILRSIKLGTLTMYIVQAHDLLLKTSESWTIIAFLWRFFLCWIIHFSFIRKLWIWNKNQKFRRPNAPHYLTWLMAYQTYFNICFIS